MISASSIFSIRHHFIDETDTSDQCNVALTPIIDNDVIFVTMSNISCEPPLVDYYIELIKRCTACSVLDKSTVLFVFIGQVHRRSDFMNLRRDIIRGLPSEIYDRLELSFVNDKSAIISLKLNAVTSSWWGMVPSLISSAHLLLSGGEFISPLIMKTNRKNPIDSLENVDIASSIIEYQNELEHHHKKWLSISRERFMSIEGKLVFLVIEKGFYSHANKTDI
jgi:hypothetical protein